ncbi:MAG: hypothetical protein ABIK81_00255 [candidate division WOR-3 bacterium]
MQREILLSIIKNTPPGSSPVWPTKATLVLQEMGIRINCEYTLTSGSHHFLHQIDVPSGITASDIIGALRPFGVEGEVYIFTE